MTEPQHGVRPDMQAGSSHAARDLLYRSLFEHAPVEVHIWEIVRNAHGAIVTWRLVDANIAALRSWGRTLADIVGKTTEEIFPASDVVATFLPIVDEIMATGAPKEWETSFAGTEQVLHMVSIPVGEYFVSTGFDVTSVHKKERELQHALQSLNQATKAGGVGLWDWDLQTNEVHYSDEWKRQLGYEPDEVSNVFDEWRTRCHPDDLARVMATVEVAMQHPQQTTDCVFRLRHKDGAFRWILAQSSFIVGEDGQLLRMLGSHVDITAQRRLEERVAESQRLESIGTLAAGIAHDFNNLLGAISGNLSLLRNTPPSDLEVPERLQEIDAAARRAQALTHQLLTFAKGGAPVREVVPIGDLVIDSARFVARGSNAVCVFAVAEDLAPVEADVGQLSQVINNLVINAIQAMPAGGTIRIGAENTSLAGVNPWGLPAGPYVRVSVADDGCGIGAEDLPRVFDPFFTTKAAGSGLGLSSSYSIVAQHDGRITVESEVGRGTTFHVFLPASGAAPRLSSPAAIIAGRGRILLMDDEASLRSVFQRMLQRLGYTCEVVSDGDEAVHHYDEALRTGHPFDAVILDLTIPGKPSGAHVLDRLRELHPEIVAIVTSGYADDDVLARHELHGFRGRLQKPVDLASLSAELSRVLG